MLLLLNMHDNPTIWTRMLIGIAKQDARFRCHTIFNEIVHIHQY